MSLCSLFLRTQVLFNCYRDFRYLVSKPWLWENTVGDSSISSWDNLTIMNVFEVYNISFAVPSMTDSCISKSWRRNGEKCILNSSCEWQRPDASIYIYIQHGPSFGPSFGNTRIWGKKVKNNNSNIGRSNVTSQKATFYRDLTAFSRDNTLKTSIHMNILPSTLTQCKCPTLIH